MSWPSFEFYMNKMRRVFEQVYRVMKYGRVICVNVSDYYEKGKRYPIIARFIVMLEDVGFNYVATIIWKKPYGTGGGGSSPAASQAGNFIQSRNPLYFKPDDITEGIIVMRKGSIDFDKLPPSVKEFKYSDQEMKELQPYFVNVWEFPPQNQSERYHPSQFPEKLPELCIKLFSLPGDVVLDPFAGSGTSGKVAKKLNRSSIQIEIDGKYIPIIKKRLGWGEKKLGREVVYRYYDMLEQERLVNKNSKVAIG